MDFKPIQRVASYPTQDTEFNPHPNPPPPAPVKHQPRLPRSIRALKNSRDSSEHPRTVVICLDGTGDRFDNDNSNIVHFVSCLKKHKPSEQVTYYQSGIGTYDQGGLQNGIGAAMDMAVGSGLGTHIKDAYKFLMQNYHDGDKICLIGFSRGAYTIRCLAGMLHKVGLLPASNISQIEFAYDFYKDDTEEGWKMSAEFKKTFCTDVNVYFVGLFDCVASVGFIPRTLPFSKSPTNSIHYFRHAMALDERRAKFKALQWEQNDLDLKRSKTIDNTPLARFKRVVLHDLNFDMAFDYFFKWILALVLLLFGPKPKAKPPPVAQTNGTAKANGTAHVNGTAHINGVGLPNGVTPNGIMSNGHPNGKQGNMEAKFNAQVQANKRYKNFETDALEVWFMGAHADVGGGAVHNESRHMLSRIPLRWMLRQCFECDTGIIFDTSQLAEQGLDIVTMWPVYEKPSKPAVGPQPSLVEKYNKKTLAPLQRRSTFLPIGPEDDTIADAPTAKDLSYILPSESTEDYFDAMAKSNDQLVDAKGWWILEFWPVTLRVLAEGGHGWEKKVSMNMGRYRAARERHPKLHWTVGYMIKEGMYDLRVRTARYTSWQEVV